MRPPIVHSPAASAPFYATRRAGTAGTLVVRPDLAAPQLAAETGRRHHDEGFPDQVVSIVVENARSLRLVEHDFE